MAALDIGGTHVTAGLVDVDAASVVTRVRTAFAADASREALVTAISDAAAAIGPADRAGVAVPGPFDYARGVSRARHKLDGLYGVDLRRELAGALGLSASRFVVFLNDADAFLLGEAWAGAARGHARAVGITLGSGLGSAFLADGVVVHAGEGVPAEGELWRIPFRGAPVEDRISARGLVARHDGAGDVERLAELARTGDDRARAVFSALGAELAEFLAPWLRSFGATCLVVGGSIARAWDLFCGRLAEGLVAVEAVEAVTVAENPEDAPLLGAARRAAAGE